MAIGRPNVDQITDRAGEFDIAGAFLRAAPRSVPVAGSMIVERATPSLVVTVFTEYLPAAASATAMSVFLPAP